MPPERFDVKRYLSTLSNPSKVWRFLFHVQVNVEHLVQKMKTTVKRGLVLRYLGAARVQCSPLGETRQGGLGCGSING